jgi:hypothetical protein
MVKIFSSNSCRLHKKRPSKPYGILRPAVWSHGKNNKPEKPLPKIWFLDGSSKTLEMINLV